MKRILIVILFQVLTYSMLAQMKVIFTKNVNRYIETDMNGTILTEEQFINSSTYEFNFDKTNDYGYIKVTDNKTGEKWKMELKEMYTGYAKGLKIYYFQSSDGKFKVSASKEENGLAIVSYKDRTMSVFYKK